MATWGPVRVIAVGGLVAVGFVDERQVFVGSHSGAAILDAATGERSYQSADTDGSYEWFTQSPPSGTWLDPEGSHTVPVAGLWGGRLPAATSDGWVIEHLADGAKLTGPDGATLVVADQDEVLALGFSPKGRVFIYATSPTLYVATR